MSDDLLPGLHDAELWGDEALARVDLAPRVLAGVRRRRRRRRAVAGAAACAVAGVAVGIGLAVRPHDDAATVIEPAASPSAAATVQPPVPGCALSVSPLVEGYDARQDASARLAHSAHSDAHSTLGNDGNTACTVTLHFTALAPDAHTYPIDLPSGVVVPAGGTRQVGIEMSVCPKRYAGGQTTFTLTATADGKAQPETRIVLPGCSPMVVGPIDAG